MLVADHDASYRTSTRTLLEAAGYAVSEADNGFTALELCRSDAPSIVLLDSTMPDGSGFAFLNAKQHDNRIMYIPVVVISAADLTPNVRVVRHLRKPVAPDVLLSIVRLVVGAARVVWQ